MSNTECPYCGHLFDPCDQFESVDQDQEVEVKCEFKECNKIFLATAYYDLNFTNEKKADHFNEKASAEVSGVKE